MKASVKIVTKNAMDEEPVSIDATIQLKADKRFDAQGVLRGLIQRILSCEDVMNTLNLRSSDKAYIAEHVTNINDKEFEINMRVDKNILPNHYVIRPRPCDERHDDSSMLYIHVRFEEA